MINYEIIKIFYPFYILFLLALIYVIYFYRLNLFIKKFSSILKSTVNKKILAADVFGAVSIANKYIDKEGRLAYLFSWKMDGVNCSLAFVSTHVLSGWTFYSSIITIESPQKKNIVVSYDELSSIYKYVRDLKNRGAKFYTYSSKDQLSWADARTEKIINYVFSLNKKSMVDFHNEKIIITMGGNFFSYLIKPADFLKIMGFMK